MAVKKVNFFFSAGCVAEAMSSDVTGATAIGFFSLDSGDMIAPTVWLIYSDNVPYARSLGHHGQYTCARTNAYRGQAMGARVGRIVINLGGKILTNYCLECLRGWP